MTEKVIDLKGMRCPMPVLKTKKALATLNVSEEITVLTDDPHAIADIAQFAKQSGHTLLSQATDTDGVTRHILRKESGLRS